MIRRSIIRQKAAEFNPHLSFVSRDEGTAGCLEQKGYVSNPGNAISLVKVCNGRCNDNFLIFSLRFYLVKNYIWLVAHEILLVYLSF